MLTPTSRSLRAAALLAVFLAGCESPAALRGALPRGSTHFSPPAVYASWWRLTEQCSGKTGDFDSVRWYVVPAADTFDLAGESVDGAWYGDGNRIAIVSGSVESGRLVRHEMLHALLQTGSHPRAEFLGSCGDIVVCVTQCVQDAGGPPDTSSTAPVIDPTTTVITTGIVPNPVSMSADSGWFTITVSATNPLSHPVRVGVPPLARTVGMRLSGTGGGEDLQLLDTTVAFAPAGTIGATRRYVFDVSPLEQGYFDLTPGNYTVVSDFLGAVAPQIPLTLAP